MGNEAIAYGAVEGGVQVVTGYPGTPSSEILGTLAKLAPQKGFYVEWSINEKVALEVGVGAALAGARTMVTMKQVGLNVAADPLMSLAYVGVKGGLVLAVADDPGPHSSQNEQDTRLFGRLAKVPVLDPATPAEAREMAREAFEISERLQLPVILRPTTRTCHACQDMEIEAITYTSRKPEGFVKGPQWVILPSLAAKKHPWLNQQQEKARRIFEESAFNRVDPVSDGTTGRRAIIAGGVSYNYVREALDLLGIDLPVLKIGTPYPLPKRLIKDFLAGVEEVLVVEEQEPVIEDQIIVMLHRYSAPVTVRGKGDGLVPREGEFNVNKVADSIARFLDVPPPAANTVSLPDLPRRGPVLCAGCPHRASFYVFKEAVQGMDAVFTGDIGCYTLGIAAPLEAVDTALCMGASIGMAAGLHQVEPGRKHVAFLGDSTFFHMGVPGLINAVYNGADITVVVLDNHTTAMTGHQPHPGTGRRATGDVAEVVNIAELARACGVKLVREVDPLVPTAAIRAAREALEYPGPAVVVMRRACVALRKNKFRYRVKAAECSECNACLLTLGCPAIEERDGKPYISDKCTGCGFCSRICPSKAIERVPS
ncbi:MAG: indolepyruvate ferredoxin oxidoreductase subunit alpha [Peptococcaceae bacterium]|nr:indolepyruvate ferredoxin oxidoreductase subunit alpha [Peptococcaceae bacterium]